MQSADIDSDSDYDTTDRMPVKSFQICSFSMLSECQSLDRDEIATEFNLD